MFGDSLIEFVNGKIAHEPMHVNEEWEAPQWRAPWRANTQAKRGAGSRSLALN